MGSQRAMCEKETIAVSVTIWISVGKVHHRIRLRILSCSRERKSSRTPKSQRQKPQWLECRDGLARITSKELAITHPAKDGILLNACSSKTRMVCRFGEKCPFAHRQVDAQPTKWSKSNNDKKRRGFIEKG